MDDFKVDALKTPKDAAKAACYTLKSSRQPVLKQVCAAMLNTTPAHLGINGYLQNNTLKNMAQAMERVQIPFKINTFQGPKEIQVPSVQRYKSDEKLQIAEFVKKLCSERGFAFYNDHILTRNHELPSMYTWLHYAEKTKFVPVLAENMPPDCQKIMINKAQWIMNEGSDGKGNHRVQTIFPTLEICPYLWEFYNQGIYDFRHNHISQEPQAEFTSCGKFINLHWDDLPSPQPVLDLIDQQVDYDLEARDNFTNGSARLFHPLINRKWQPGLCHEGPSNSFKTSLLNLFLKTNFSTMKVYCVDKNPKSQFQ